MIDGLSSPSAVVEHRGDLGRLGGGEDHEARDREPKHHVEHAVVARAVVAGDACPVRADHDRRPVESDVEVLLVETTRQERRVDRDDRAESGHRHPAAAVIAWLSAMPTSKKRSG